MSYEILKRHREIWKRKNILRDIYHDWYKLIVENMADNKPSLEIGGGVGNFKEFYPNVVSSDFTFCEWVDVNLDAHRLPFKKNSLGNIVMIDVLHHLENPYLLFHEVKRVLKDKGRVVMLEPYISTFSYIIYNYFHQEDVDFKIDVWRKQIEPKNKKAAFDGNSAVPTIMFYKGIKQFREAFPHLKIVKKELLTFVIYPLSGGFERRNLIPDGMLKYVGFIEKILRPLGLLFAFRIFIVLEKDA